MTQDIEPKSKNHFDALDGLRAFAIILVMLCHSSWHFSPLNFNIGPIALQNIFYNGWCGVDLFFVLSGFLITTQIIAAPITSQTYINFIMRRFFRIAPAYYISVTLFLLFYKIIPELMSQKEALNIWIIPYLAHLLFLQDYIGREPVIENTFWSIPVEIKFYLLCPFLICIIGMAKNVKLQIAIILTILLSYLCLKIFFITTTYGFQNILFEDFNFNIKTKFHFALEGLLTGVLCAVIFNCLKNLNLKNNMNHGHIYFILGLLLFLALSLSNPYFVDVAKPFEQTFLSAGYALCFGFMVFGALFGNIANSFLSSRPLRFIAKISYSMYLTHIFTFGFQHTLHSKLFYLTNNNELSWILLLPFYFGLTIGLSFMLYNYIEKPFINWSKKKWGSIS